MTKVARQPMARSMAMKGTTRGVTIAPTLLPALNRPAAKARSRLGNHSATALMPAGKPPPSPTPSSIRAAMNPLAERTAAWLIWPMVQMTKATA